MVETESNQRIEQTPIIRPLVRISVRNLVEFILRSGDIDSRHKGGDAAAMMQEGSRIHRMIQRRMGSEYHAEVFLRHTISNRDYDIVIEGRADGVIYSDKHPEKLTIIDEIKSTFTELEYLKKPSELHLAQAKCYAYIVANDNDLDEIGVRMTYCNVDSQEIKYFHETYLRKEITDWFDRLIESYSRWADFEFLWKKQRNSSIHELKFPYSYRDGQKELITQVYHTLYQKKRLYIEAPTGVGKTISTVFPTVKAMGQGMCDKIFYLTAKTITRTVANDCFELLRDAGLSLKSVIITAKEKICPLEKCECNPDACIRAKGHFDRINDAMYDLLISSDSFDRESIEKYATRHKVCPFEMGLDMSLFADAIICDYNYVFDPNVYLRRFFSDGISGEYIFLVDEAHNLVDRGQAMYSASLYKESFMEIKRLVKAHDKKLERGLENCNKQFLALKRDCECFKQEESLSALVVSLNRLMGLLERFLDEKDRFEARDMVTELYLLVRHFLNMYDNMGSNDYVMYSEMLSDGRFMVKLYCTNPSASLRRCLDKGRSTVFFSATLLPIDYFMDMLSGDRSDYTVYARSIFDNRKRGLYIASDVSSKYTRRNDAEYLKIAEYIFKITRETEGNYLVFFPSHAYLNNVLEKYNEYFITDDTEVICQKTSMSESDREEFLAKFGMNGDAVVESNGNFSEDLSFDWDNVEMISEDEFLLEVLEDSSQPFSEISNTCNINENTVTNMVKKPYLIGFCVIGGIFSEGIDLREDSLIGAIIVGTGLPMVCNERELLKKSIIEQNMDGYDYAYKFPGMNKVLQAAGRVIRTVKDVGVVVLLDERFLSSQYKKIFPREWKDFEVVHIYDVEEHIRDFWNSHMPQQQLLQADQDSW